MNAGSSESSVARAINNNNNTSAFSAAAASNMDLMTAEQRIAARRDRIAARKAAQSPVQMTSTGRGGGTTVASTMRNSVKATKTKSSVAIADAAAGEEPPQLRSTHDALDNQRQQSQLVLHASEESQLATIREAMEATQLRELTRRQQWRSRIDSLQKKRSDNDAAIVQGAAAQPQTTDNATVTAVTTAGPYRLQEQLTAQKLQCKQLEALRVQVIATYKHDIDQQDEQYTDELKRQALDINSLISRLSVQQTDMRRSCREQLKHLETAMMMERATLIKQMWQSWERVTGAIRDKLHRHFEGFPDRAQEHIQLADQTRDKDAEDLNATRDMLETEIHVLTQQLEQMKATYQLNMEKLEYNFQILKKRDDENSGTVTAQKRRINRMHDIVTTLRKRLAKQGDMFQRQFQQLTDDYERVASQFKELQDKLNRVHANNQKLYQELWDMHATEIRRVLQKIARADRVVWEELLHLNWQCPAELSVFLSTTAEVRADSLDGSYDSKMFPMENSFDGTSTGYISGQKLLATLQNESSRVRAVVELVISEIGHLLVSSKLQVLLNTLPPNEQFNIKAELVCRSFQIETEVDLQSLVELFVAGDGQLVPPEMVMTQLKAFTARKRTAAAAKAEEGVTLSVPEPSKGGSAADNSPDSAEREGLQKWEELAQLADGPQFKTWERIHTAMVRYHDVLKDRDQVWHECDALATENAELRRLLGQQQDSAATKSLMLAPHQLEMMAE